MMDRLVLPDELSGLPVVASVSGGKDSTALMLALREAEIPFRAVFADTGWEAPETYAYLDLLRERIGPIAVVRAEPKVLGVGGMIDRIHHRANFPARMQRWCTRELKVDPIRKYHDALGVETVSAVGIRADESAARANAETVSDDHEWGGWIWRPLLRWTVADVLAIHHRHAIPVNPLYQRGFSRVGCFPCIFSSKEEIRLLAEHAPEKIAEIEQLEAAITEDRARRNAVQPGRYAHPKATFFISRGPDGAIAIRDVVEWARTVRGGRQLLLLQEPPTGGCFRWGMCEAPAKDTERDEARAEVERLRAELGLAKKEGK